MLKVVQQSVELPGLTSRLVCHVPRFKRPCRLHGRWPGHHLDGSWHGVERLRRAHLGADAGAHHAATDRSELAQFEWHEADLDAILVLTFTAASVGARVDLVQVGVPDRLFDTLVSGWPARYWQPWRVYLKSG